MDIHAHIEKIKYQSFLAEQLTVIDLNSFDINSAPTACLLQNPNTKSTFALSKWVSPKRTRSYPYERVYNTLGICKKITVIPIVKDEGQKGDRDYLQWDTVSFMSLLDVYVIFAYYDNATAAGQKITNQTFDNQYIKQKIQEIEQFHSSALHWNLEEIKQMPTLLGLVKNSYERIAVATKIKLHSVSGLDKFALKIGKEVEHFKTFSREKAEQAQARELVTVQPKEALSTATKSKITITNYLGGAYYFTVDEIEINKNTIQLIESKHTKNSLLPSKSDIKDGLLKLILYANLATIRIGQIFYEAQPTLKLTSAQLSPNVSLYSSNYQQNMETFAVQNKLSEAQKKLISDLFEEAEKNNFVVIIQYAV